MKIDLTKKQLKELTIFKLGKLRRINLYDGSVRSGKTFISLIIFFMWVYKESRKKQSNFMIIGKTLTTLKRNILELAVQILGKENFSYSISKKEADFAGIKIYLEGANDVKAQDKIRGMTLKGAYLDEVSLLPEDFFNMLLSRLSEPKAKLFGTTNPDSPNHWLKVNFIDLIEEKSLNMRYEHFLLSDNTTLPSEYVEDLKKEYVGVFYDRFILGRWVAAEGVIYKEFADNNERYFLSIKEAKELKFDYIGIGIDPGQTISATAIVATGIYNNYKNLIVLKSERIKDALSPREFNNIVDKFTDEIIKDYGKIDVIYIDNTEQILRRGLEEEFQHLTFKNSIKNEVIDRIRAVMILQSQDRFKITEKAESVINALNSALWEENIKTKRLDNGSTPIDDLDAMEYSFEKYLKLLLANK